MAIMKEMVDKTAVSDELLWRPVMVRHRALLYTHSVGAAFVRKHHLRATGSARDQSCVSPFKDSVSNSQSDSIRLSLTVRSFALSLGVSTSCGRIEIEMQSNNV